MAERDDVSPVDRPTPGTRGGRPSKLTLRVERTILAAIEKGCSFRLSAMAAGISPDALHSWRKLGAAGHPRYIGFVRRLGIAEAKAAQRWLERIDAAAESGS